MGRILKLSDLAPVCFHSLKSQYGHIAAQPLFQHFVQFYHHQSIPFWNQNGTDPDTLGLSTCLVPKFEITILPRCCIAVIVKPDPHIHQFSENTREHWARMGKQVICWSVYLYILAIRHYASNTFSAVPNSSNRQILANTYVKNQFLPLLVNLCENN